MEVMFQAEKGTHPVDLVETVHVQLPDETRKLFKGQMNMRSRKLMRMEPASQNSRLRCCV
jgi:hypothetical protein